MSDTHTRKKTKKNNLTKGADSLKLAKNQGANAGHEATSTPSTTLFWLPIVIAVALYCYFNPSVVTGFVEEWIGFSEHYDTAPVAHQASIAHLPADYAKRDAVVAAFKASGVVVRPSGSILIKLPLPLHSATVSIPGTRMRDAMGDDEYHPIGKRGSNLTKAGGVGYMIVDVLDTMQIMKLDSEYYRARKWVEQELSFERDDRFSTFETTIRVLGGLLSAHYLSGGDALYLGKATELADKLMAVFETKSGLPLPVINLAKKKGYHTDDFPGLSSIAEIATLQLEFRYLSHLTGDDRYWKAVVKVMQVVRSARLPHGLASIFMSIDEGQFYSSTIRLGSRADSFYEYLLKQYLQTNNSEDIYREMYEDAMDAIHGNLIQQTASNKMTYTSEIIPEQGQNDEIDWRLTPKQDHLVCFLGGSLMLGATRAWGSIQPVSVPPRLEELSEKAKRDWATGVELVKTCMHTHDTATGLSPEIVYFRVPSDGMDGYHNAPSDWYIKGAAVGEFPPYDARYMLRPETVESLFIAYRLTGDQLYRDQGWQIFQSIEKHCLVETGGFTTILNVDENPARQEDKMETFFLSETLKYLYLLFESSNVLPLSEHVFNTEAHPFPIFNPQSSL